MSEIRERLNVLLSHYDEQGQNPSRVVAVPVVRGTLLRWGIKPVERGGPIVYRGRELRYLPDGYTLEAQP